MTETHPGNLEDPLEMLDCLESLGKVCERKLRLLAVACCRRIWPLIPDERSRRAVEVAEQYAEGLTSLVVLLNAYREASGVPFGHGANAAKLAADAASNGLWATRQAIQNCIWAAATERIRVIAAKAKQAGEPVGNLWDEEVRAGAQAIEAKRFGVILRDVFRFPPDPLLLDPSWLTPTVIGMAKAVYSEPELPSGRLDTARIAILADAMLDAGCDDVSLLSHLQEPVHVRGCFAVDAILGKS